MKYQIQKPNQKGFTLIEILIALVVIAGFVAVVYTLFQRTQDSGDSREFTNSVRELAIGCAESKVGNSYAGTTATTLIRGDYAPAQLISGNTLRHQFNGTIIVSSYDFNGGTDNACEMRWNTVPSNVCNRVINNAGDMFAEIQVGSTIIKSPTVTPTGATIATACNNAANTIRFRST